MSLSASGLKVDVRSHAKGTGIPRRCRCGEGSIVRTSTTVTNPCRLFHCCPFGSKENNFHLFKWTDESMFDEVEDIEIVGDKI
ncbi:hypothetical protein V5N11_030322 [Cardamine amara subsp. amara]|uniref:GRF-type domain-containing protein n=1 Tax=Cardamine amara subsp. amara TaxID=228776 RepID=A0ABD1B1Y4_CARAN